MKRRHFIKRAGITTFLAGSGAFPDLLTAADLERPEIEKLCILHTNDVHSHLEPFPMDGGRFEGMGGAARRLSLIKKIRATEKQVLLLDCGDVFQGTPYFNLYNGELDIKVMSEMQYDASTIGNHEFDAGMEGLAQQIDKGGFPFLNCNYDFSDTPLLEKTLPYKIFEKGAIKIGVLGVGIELEGLVPGYLIGNTQYQDPIAQANKYAAILKHDHKCDYVICLSHLGFQYKRNDKVSDQILAERSTDLDLILGGHTHTFLPEPLAVKNAAGRSILINQVGFAGICLGRLDVYFEKRKKGFRSESSLIAIGKGEGNFE